MKSSAIVVCINVCILPVVALSYTHQYFYRQYTNKRTGHFVFTETCQIFLKETVPIP